MKTAEETRSEASLFESVPLNEVKMTCVKKIHEQATELYKTLAAMPKSREMSLAITNLEQSVMWSTKGISRAPG